MLHFIGFLAFVVGLVVLSLALALNYDEGFSGWPLANILMLAAGAVAVFVLVVGHFALRKLARPALMIVIFYILELFLCIATFVYCFMHFPYNDCRKGTVNGSSKGCKMDKAAVPMVGVLMGLFFISSVILIYDFISWNRRGNSPGGKKSRVSRWYY